jgi:thiamine-phosphate pyrophosphorylase
VRTVGVAFRLYLITDRRLAGARGLIATCEAALQGAPRGAVAIQLREKDLEARELFELACQMRQLCDRYGASLLVNDRIDVAIAARADGVHLASKSIGAADARNLLGSAALIGVSTHSPADVINAAEQGADFVVFGPVFAPLSKSGHGTPQGRDGLTAACRAASIPVFALGGITPERVAAMADCGAVGAGVIGWVIGADDPGRAVESLIEAVARFE